MAQTLGLPTLIAGWIGLFFMLAWSVKTAPWYKLQNKTAQHVLLAMSVVIFSLWQLDVSIHQGVSLHLLLVTLLTLMFGVQFAFFAVLLALLGVVWQQQLGWQAYAINALLMGIVPILITWGLYRLGAKFLAANFFVYLLYNGFFSATLSMVAVMALSALVLSINDVLSGAQLMKDFVIYIPLMATPEGVLNTFLLMMLIFLKPEWVMTFYQDKYFNNKS